MAWELISDMHFFESDLKSKNVQRNWVVGMVTNQHNELPLYKLFMCENNLLNPSGPCNSWDPVPVQGAFLLWYWFKRERSKGEVLPTKFDFGAWNVSKTFEILGFSLHLTMVLSNIWFFKKFLDYLVFPVKVHKTLFPMPSKWLSF